MIGCESAPVEGTVTPQGHLFEGEMGVLPGRTCFRFIRVDESGIMLSGTITRKRIEGGTPRFMQVAGGAIAINPLAPTIFRSSKKYGFLFSDPRMPIEQNVW